MTKEEAIVVIESIIIEFEELEETNETKDKYKYMLSDAYKALSVLKGGKE